MRTWAARTPGRRQRITVKKFKSTFKFKFLTKSLINIRKVFTKYLLVNYNARYLFKESKILTVKKQPCNSNSIFLVQSLNGLYQYILGCHKINVMSLVKFTSRLVSVKDIGLFWGKIKCIYSSNLCYNIAISNRISVARSAGVFCKIIGHSKNNQTKLQLPSKVIKHISSDSICFAGRAGNILHKFEQYGSAGYKKFFFLKPEVRGEAQNAVDHPHGGRTRKGRPKHSPWGWVIH